ncbi:PHA/PHB synthase family protein [Ramlibacter sp. PS4R-6]|uniref:PHA/PHB synthase family protein n=1 Tax=Ramlibacter sp. PS4R-6 TaxID=3133438 RepID=UPI0030B565C0
MGTTRTLREAAAATGGKAMRTAAEWTELVASAVDNTLTFNPLLGVRRRDVAESAAALARVIAAAPRRNSTHAARLLRELREIAGGSSAIAADPKDRRFADPAWQGNPFHKRLLQTYLATQGMLGRAVDESSLDERTKARARFFTSLAWDAMAPSNWLLGNPAALRKTVESGGRNVWQGARHMVDDLLHNDGMPTQVDASPYKVGENIATTPGQVVLRHEMFELIQYAPSTPKVHARPLIMSPPQVNKYYAIDLTPEKSLAKWAVDSGIQFFVISWRNPTVEHGHWGLDDYVLALDAAVEAAKAITGSADVNMWGSCSGGMTLAAYLGWLAARGEEKVAHVTWAVCILDTHDAFGDGALGIFNTPSTLGAAKARSRRRGIVTGREMASMFAWLRSNDLVWNYWVNNYLMGNKPPAHDILAWNSDNTALPGRFHCDLLELLEHNPYRNPGKLEVAGEAIDMRRVKAGAYVIAGTNDHITPWRACYRTARMFGPNSRFVLANAGHLQSLVNPPGQGKAFYMSGPASKADADAWLQSAKREEGSWWPDWRVWIQRRSGPRVEAPVRLGSRRYKPLGAAPGTYVLE